MFTKDGLCIHPHVGFFLFLAHPTPADPDRSWQASTQPGPCFTLRPVWKHSALFLENTQAHEEIKSWLIAILNAEVCQHLARKLGQTETAEQQLSDITTRACRASCSSEEMTLGCH